MKCSREIKTNGYHIEEFYWAGKYVVYINNRKYEDNYESAIQQCELDTARRFCLRCDGEIKEDQKACVNDEGDFAHYECLGWDDFDENWTKITN